jgi:hypothetical protein
MWTFDNIRHSCRFVAENSEFVHINYDKIENYASKLARIKPDKPHMDSSCHYVGHGDDTVAFFVMLNSINFGSGYSPYLRKRPGMSGYYTIASGLNEFFKKKPIAVKDLKNISSEDCAAILGQKADDRVVNELMKLYATSLRDLGNYVVDHYDSSFNKMIETAGASSEKLVETLSVMRFFRDTAEYKGMQVAFFKRAQILSLDLSIAFDGQGIGRFEDLHKLTMFADNLVPHVLRVDGILEYEETLASRINNSELITQGSREEIEIRACAVDAVERISQIMGGYSKGASPAIIDNVLWHRGQQAYYKKIMPRHRTRSVFY